MAPTARVDRLFITSGGLSSLLSRLERAGLIARVWRGLYLVPRRLPLGGKWSPDEALALNTLMAAKQGRYQICGPNAFNFHGFDEQNPARVYAYHNRISGERQIGTVAGQADARVEGAARRDGPVGVAQVLYPHARLRHVGPVAPRHEGRSPLDPGRRANATLCPDWP